MSKKPTHSRYKLTLRKRLNQRHPCFCGRTLHNDRDWEQHKQTCPTWKQDKETK